jgi:hypothetical protein
MSIKMTLIGAALTLSMAPLAARADDGYYQQQQPQYEQQPYEQPQYQQQPYQAPAYEQAPNQAWPTYQAPAYQQGQDIAVGEPCPTDRQGDRTGRYEQRSVQRFVQGQYQQIWVPEQCSMRMRQRGWWRQAGTVCVPAHYDQQWTPGHYESTQQWVWVSFGFHGHHHFWGGGFYNRGS